MKLCATISSERGKTVQKTGNDFIKIVLTRGKKEVAHVHMYDTNTIIVYRAQDCDINVAKGFIIPSDIM